LLAPRETVEIKALLLSPPLHLLTCP